MLVVADIEKHFERFVAGLNKRGIQDAKNQLKAVLDKDAERKEIQRKLDAILHESNKISKEIGQLFQQGKKEEFSTISSAYSV